MREDRRPRPARPRPPHSARPPAAPASAPRPAPGSVPAPGPPAGAPGQILEVQFKGLRSDFFSFTGVRPLAEREYVVVAADRGQDIGSVKRAAASEDLACEGGCDHVGVRHVPPPSRRVIRRAAPADVLRLLQLRDQELEVRRRTRELVGKHRLRMKVSEAECSGTATSSPCTSRPRRGSTFARSCGTCALLPNQDRTPADRGSR